MLKSATGLFALSLFAAVLGRNGAVAAPDGGSLAGTWSGGGSVTFGSGSKERARCRATYSRTSKTSYVVNATCATPSGRVSQSATVRGSGSNYSGSFYNPDYDASGTISVTVHGASQTVRLVGSKGSALLRLSR